MAEPALPSTPARFKEADLTNFWSGGLLWAINQFVLWPLGLAISMVVDPEKPEVRGPIQIREWVADDGHQETIEDDSEAPDFDRWLAFSATIRDRLMKMPLAERRAAAQRLALLGIGVVVPTGQVISPRPQAHWLEE